MVLSTKKSRKSHLYYFVPTLLILFVLIAPSASMADSDGKKQTLLERFSNKIKLLQKKVESLEKGHARLYHSLEEKKAAGLGTKISENIKIGALIELEASVDSNDKGGDTSDIVLATFQLALDADINENVTGHVQLLYEEDDTPLEVDEGTITVASPSGFSFTGGKMYIPFGVFNSHFISKPNIVQLGEANESAVMIAYATDTYEASGGFFNGTVDETGKDNKIHDFFLSFNTTPMEGLTLGAYYTSDIGESNYVEGILTSASASTDIISGYGGFVSLEISGITIDAEYITASDRFNVADLDINADSLGDEPSAYNIEVGYPLNDAMEVAVKLEGNKDLFDLPESQYGAALSYGLYENVSISAEILFGEYEDNNERTIIATQLGIEF